MNRIYSSLGATFALAALLLFTMGGAKCKDDCENVICAPCPSSRLMIRYVDSAGNCDSAFNASAIIYGLNAKNTAETLFTYTLSDTCLAAFLIQEDVEYHLIASNFSEIITFGEWEYQAPIEVTECCLCYPVEHANVAFNFTDTTHVEWTEGLYDNPPITRVIN